MDSSAIRIFSPGSDTDSRCDRIGDSEREGSVWTGTPKGVLASWHASGCLFRFGLIFFSMETSRKMGLWAVVQYFVCDTLLYSMDGTERDLWKAE